MTPGGLRVLQKLGDGQLGTFLGTSKTLMPQNGLIVVLCERF